MALIEAIDDDGYLREAARGHRATALRPEIVAAIDEIVTVLHQVQRFDPVGVGARNLAECLCVQLALLPDDTPGTALALRIAAGPLERLPEVGIAGLAARTAMRAADDVERGGAAAALARSAPRRADRRPADRTYVTPDCVVWRQQGAVAGRAGRRQPAAPGASTAATNA